MSVAMGKRKRQLWLDTRGVPVITTTPNGEKNAKRWGWTPATAIPTTALDVDELVVVLHDAVCVCDHTTHPAESWVNWTNYARAVVAHLTKGDESDE